MAHQDAIPPIVLSYGHRRRRGISFLPWAVVAMHFVGTTLLWTYEFNNFKRDIVSAIGNSAYRPPPITMADRVMDICGWVLMKPVTELSLEINPYYIIALNSLCWGFACWCLLRFLRRKWVLYDPVVAVDRPASHP
jgi:hypothetical protein